MTTNTLDVYYRPGPLKTSWKNEKAGWVKLFLGLGKMKYPWYKIATGCALSLCHIQ